MDGRGAVVLARPPPYFSPALSMKDKGLVISPRVCSEGNFLECIRGKLELGAKPIAFNGFLVISLGVEKTERSRVGELAPYVGGNPLGTQISWLEATFSLFLAMRPLPRSLKVSACLFAFGGK